MAQSEPPRCPNLRSLAVCYYSLLHGTHGKDTTLSSIHSSPLLSSRTIINTMHEIKSIKDTPLLSALCSAVQCIFIPKIYVCFQIQSFTSPKWNLFPFSVVVEPCGIRSNGVNSNHRSVHCVCTSHFLPCDSIPRLLCPWTLQSGSVWRPCGMDCGSVGVDHIGSVFIACVVPSHCRDTQLHACCGGRFANSHGVGLGV